MKLTPFGSYGAGAIGSCNTMSCPNGSSEPTYSDDFIEVTKELLIDGCYD